MNNVIATVNGMDKMVKEHDVCVYLLMTKTDKPMNREPNKPAAGDEFEFWIPQSPA